MMVTLLLLTLCTVVVVLAAGQESASTRPVYPKGEGRCQGCAYELSGLPDEAACPECGRTDPGAPVQHITRRILRPLVLSRMGVVLVWSLAAHIGVIPFARAANVWSYRLQLNTEDSATIDRVIRVRGFDLEWEVSLVPLTVATCVSAVCCLMSGETRVNRLTFRIVAAGWIASIACLFGQTYLTYG